MENNLVSEIILVLIPTGDRKIKNKKRSAKKKLKILRCLLDSGSTGNVLSNQHVHFSTNTRRANKIWRTAAGTFRTTKEIEQKVQMTEFSESKDVSINFNVHEGNIGPYDAIIGRRTMQELGLILDFKNDEIIWEGTKVCMKHPDELASKEQLFATFLGASEPIMVQ